LSDGYSIEEHYQLAVKGHGVLGVDDWRIGKGKPPKGNWQGEELYLAYRALWEQWARENPQLMGELRSIVRDHGYLLSDRFATTPISQARALADILNQT